jgi:hypothetical protein
MPGTPDTISGVRKTTNIQSARRVVDMAPKIILLEDDRKALMTFVSSLGRRNVTNPKFDWLTDEIIPKYCKAGDTIASATATAQYTAALNLGGNDTDVIVKVDDLLKLPHSGEIVRVSATPTNMTAVDVYRNTNGVAAAASTSAASGTLLVKIGNAREEFSRVLTSAGAPIGLTTKEATASNYTQTFRNTFGLSRRELKSKLYGQEERAYQRMKKLMEHCEEINNAMWHGVSGTDSTDTSRTYTGGLISFVPSGNTETITTLTEDELEDFLRVATRYGNTKRKVLFASRYIQQLISAWARNNQRVTKPGGEIKYGVHMTEYHSGTGAVMDVITDHALEGVPGSSTVTGWDKEAVLVDPENVKLAVFGSDYMKLEVDLELPDMDGLVDSYISDVGLQAGNAAHHSRINGVVG